MPFSPPAPPQRMMILLACVLAVLLAIAAIMGITHFMTQKSDTPVAVTEAPLAAGEATLPGRGRLPHLHIAAARDRVLQDMVTRLAQLPADQIFIDSQDADLILVGILFRWAGVEETETGLYGPYIDARIVEFMKAIGSIPATLQAGQDIPAEDATALNTRWFGIFDYYRTRLLIQISGKAVYNQDASYELDGDRIVVNGDISAGFVREFQEELLQTRNSGQAMHGFLDFISATKGFEALDDAEQDLIMSLNAGDDAAAQQPVAPGP